MSTPIKIVTFTEKERDEYRKLRDAANAAQKAFNEFTENFKKRNAPTNTRRYVPFETVEMTILDQPDPPNAGTTHAWFTKELE